MASTVAAQQIVVRGRQTQNSFKPLAYLKSETLKAPAQNVGARYTALHSLPQPPITHYDGLTPLRCVRYRYIRYRIIRYRIIISNVLQTGGAVTWRSSDVNAGWYFFTSSLAPLFSSGRQDVVTFGSLLLLLSVATGGGRGGMVSSNNYWSK